MDKTFDDLRVMLKANYPLLYFATSEYDRVKQKVRRIAFDMNYSFNSWDIVEGLSSHTKNQNNKLEKVDKHKLHGSTKNATAFLGEIKALIEAELKEEAESNKIPTKEIYFLEDFHKYFRDESVLVYLRKLTTLLKGSNKHLILVSPFLKLPDELEKYVTIVNVPLPDRDDLKIRLNFVKDKEYVNPDLGINAGATFSKLDGTRLITPQGTGNDLNDDDLSNQIQKSIRPNLSAGISFVHKYIETGIVYTNIINSKDKFKGEINTLNPKYGGVLQVYASSKVKIGDDFSVRPSLVLNTDFKEFQTDFSFMAGYKDYVSLGFNVRGYNKKSFESLSPIISVGPLKNICIIYSYDVSLNKLNTVNKGSHEITLNYFLPNKKLYKTPKIINNPRFL